MVFNGNMNYTLMNVLNRKLAKLFCKIFSILSIGKCLAQCLLLACYHFLLLLFCANLILLAHCAFTPLPQLHSNHLGNFNTAECSCIACPSLNQFKGLSVLTYHGLLLSSFVSGTKNKLCSVL